MLNTVIELGASPANDNGRARGEIGGIKSLLCDLCGREESLADGVCGTCMADADTLVADRRGLSDWRGDDDCR